MTDLFLSASAALIVALALSSNEPVRQVPVQADVLLLCPSNSQGEGRYALFIGAMAKPRHQTDGEGEMTIEESSLHRFVDLNGFNLALSSTTLVPRLFHTAALVSSQNHPLTTKCIKALTGLVRANNKRGKHSGNGVDASPPLFGGTIGFQITSAKIRVASDDGK